ncbi:MAG: hypothetical protein JWM73_724 [Solirubrobacterales bacterium]|nr:hypothetical protein [Solirubrobacterales bacterium]
MNPGPSCPLCGHPPAGRSWFGETRFAGQTFVYLECGSCASFFCDPMPSPGVLSRMYDATYDAHGPDDAGLLPTMALTLAALAQLPRGRFLDYGCGSGALVVAAAGQGWDAEGVEFDPDVCARLRSRTGRPMMSRDSALSGRHVPYDVINLGDVLEHLTDPLAELLALRPLLAPGGTLLAQGPLEANPHVFFGVLQAAARARRRDPAEIPPYHVTLATADGQLRLFGRAGLRTLSYRVSEVAWPAPERLTRSVIGDQRQLGLFALRRISKAGTRLAPARWAWGNRYAFAGRAAPEEPAR